MGKPLRVLMVEDSEDDVLLMIRALKKGGYDPVYERVETAEAMRTALRKKTWDIILCDYKIPGFNGLAAIALLKEGDIDIPLIIVSGAIGEETAVECMRLGAHDYVMKGNLSRLVPAIERELKEAESRSQRKQAEKALKESENKYRLLADNVNDVIFVLDMNLNYTYISPSVKILRGYEPEEVMKHLVNETLTPSSGDLAVKTLSEVMELEKSEHREISESRTLELEMRRKDGTTVWTEVKLSFIRDENQRPVGILGVTRDITERKRAEEALRESESLSKSLIDYMHDAMIIINWDGSILFANRAAARIIEFERPEEFVGHNMVEYLHPDSFQKAAEDLEAVKADKMGFLSEYKLCSVTGRRIWVESIGGKIIFRNASANLVCIRDITERKRAEEALRESEEKYRWVVDNMADVITVMDMNLRFTYVSPSIMRMRGYTAEEAMAQTFEQVMTPESLQIVAKVFEEEMKLEASGTADPGRSRILELEQYRKDGSIVWMENHLSFLRDEAQKPVGIISLTRDITDRKQAEKKLQQTLESLRKAVGTTIQVMVSAVEARDPYTAGHQLRSADLARAIATEMGLAQEKIEGIRMAGSIHDIGKLSIPAEILSKPTKLTEH